MDVHSKIKKLQEALDELKKEIGYSEEESHGTDELGEELTFSSLIEEDQDHFETHRL